MAGCLPKRILRETEKLISEPVPGIDARPDEQNARCVFCGTGGCATIFVAQWTVRSGFCGTCVTL